MHLSASWSWLLWLPKISFFKLLLISNYNIFNPFWLTFSVYQTQQINTCLFVFLFHLVCFLFVVLFCSLILYSFVLCLCLFFCFLFLFTQRIVHLVLIHHNVVRIPMNSSYKSNECFTRQSLWVWYYCANSGSLEIFEENTVCNHQNMLSTWQTVVQIPVFIPIFFVVW